VVWGTAQEVVWVTVKDLATLVRHAVEDYEIDGAAPYLVCLYRDGDSFAFGSGAIFMIKHAKDFPGALKAASEDYHKEHPEAPAVAYLLVLEATLLSDPGIESARAYFADIHGRLWRAVKRSDRPGIKENYYPPGKWNGEYDEMRDITHSLLAVAYYTGMMYHGLPGPQGWLN
jgi:hypothetical protein